MRTLQARRGPFTTRRDHGVVLPLFALLLVAIVLMVSLAIDLGRQRIVAAQLQSGADLVALDLVRLADGRTQSEIVSDSSYATTRDRSLDANGLELSEVTIEYGIGGATNFVASAPTEVPNTVRVQANRYTEYYFAVGGATPGSDTRRVGFAQLRSTATLELGSRLGDLRSGNSNTLNPALSSLTGGNINLSAVEYQGLANANVTLGDLAVSLGFATEEEFLNANVTFEEVTLATADVLNNNGDPTSAAVYTVLANEVDDTYTFQPVSFLGIGTNTGSAAGVSDLNAFGIFIASAGVVNAATADDPGSAAASCAAIPGFEAVPLASASLNLCSQVTESSKYARGVSPGDADAMPPEFRTAQIKAELQAAGDVNVLALTGSIDLTVLFEGAGAEGTLDNVICNADTGVHTTDTTVQPRALVATIGNGSDPVLELSDALSLVTVEVFIDKEVNPATDASALIDDQIVEELRAGPGSSPTLGLSVTADDVDVVVSSGTLPLGVTEALIEAQIVAAANLILIQLDAVGSPALGSLGINLADSDLYLEDITCNTPYIVGV